MSDKPQTKTPDHSKWPHQIAAFVIGIAAFSIIVASALVLYGYTTKDKIAHTVNVAGVSIGGLSYDAAKSKIDQFYNTKKSTAVPISIDTQTVNPTAEELGLQIDTQATVDQAFAIGKQPNLFTRYLSLLESVITVKEIDVPKTVNRDKTIAYINGTLMQANKPAVNATLKVSGSSVEVVESQDGLGIDEEKLLGQITTNLTKTDSPSAITVHAESLPATIKAKDLTVAKSEAEQIMSHQMSLTFENKTYGVTAAVIGGWLDFSQDGSNVKAAVSDTKIGEYVAGIAKKIDIKAKDRELSDVDRSVLSEGSDGRNLNRSVTINQIKTTLNDGNTANKTTTLALQVDPVNRGEKVVKQPFTPGLYPGKYIEVNLSAQRMYLWEGTNKIREYVVSTGKWSTPTPIGTRYVENKTTRAWSAKFKLYMPFWMSLGGGYGIHELPEWPGGKKEGESHLGTPVSHGCIRLGIGSAEEVYNWTDVGTPVYIHTN